jgi:hypothetical protein
MTPGVLSTSCVQEAAVLTPFLPLLFPRSPPDASPRSAPLPRRRRRRGSVLETTRAAAARRPRGVLLS